MSARSLAVRLLPVLALLALAAMVASVAKANTISSVEITPTNTSICDGCNLTITLVAHITNITESPAAEVYWGMKVPSAVFNLTPVAVEAWYMEADGSVHSVTPQVSVGQNGPFIEVRIESAATENITVNVTVVLRALPGVYPAAPAVIEHPVTLMSGDKYYQNINNPATTTVYIVPTPPTVEARPSLRLVAPGIPVNVTLSAFDASGVANASVRVVVNESTVVLERSWGPSDTGNATRFQEHIAFTPEATGNYTIEFRACDIGGYCNTTTARLEVRSAFHVPEDFPTLSTALAYEGLGDGSVIVVDANVTEESTVIVAKRVSIIGVNGATVKFANVSVGFNVTAEGASFTWLRVEGASVGFQLCTNGVALSGVSVSAERFLEVCGLAYTNNTVEDSTLNGSPVAYIYGGGSLPSGEYAEAHLYNGSYTLANATIASLYTGAASIEARSASIGLLEDLGLSRITIVDGSVEEYRGTASSSIEMLRHLTVTVTLGGEPVEGATITVAGGLLAEPLREIAPSNGSVTVYVPVARGAASIEAENYTVTATACYYGLRAEATVDLREVQSVELKLPQPQLTAELLSLTGQKLTKLERGQLFQVNATVLLQGFTGNASITIALKAGNETVAAVRIPLPQGATEPLNVKALMMVPWWADESYSVTVILQLEGLKPVTVTLP